MQILEKKISLITTIIKTRNLLFFLIKIESKLLTTGNPFNKTLAVKEKLYKHDIITLATPRSVKFLNKTA